MGWHSATAESTGVGTRQCSLRYNPVRTIFTLPIMTTWHENIFCVTRSSVDSPHRMPVTQSFVWCFLWCAPEQTVEQQWSRWWSDTPWPCLFEVTVILTPERRPRASWHRDISQAEFWQICLSSAKCRPFCSDPNMLNDLWAHILVNGISHPSPRGWLCVFLAKPSSNH